MAVSEIKLVFRATDILFCHPTAAYSSFRPAFGVPLADLTIGGFLRTRRRVLALAAYRATQLNEAHKPLSISLPRSHPPARRGVKSSAGLQIRRIFSFPTHHPITFCFVFEKTLARPDWCGHQPAPVLEDDRARSGKQRIGRQNALPLPCCRLDLLPVLWGLDHDEDRRLHTKQVFRATGILLCHPTVAYSSFRPAFGVPSADLTIGGFSNATASPGVGKNIVRLS